VLSPDKIVATAVAVYVLHDPSCIQAVWDVCTTACCSQKLIYLRLKVVRTVESSHRTPIFDLALDARVAFSGWMFMVTGDNVPLDASAGIGIAVRSTLAGLEPSSGQRPAVVTDPEV